jgi:peptidyl carrier protein
MDRAVVTAHLKKYIETNILKDDSTELAESTPLLEWGILNSLSTAQLINHIREHFELFVPAEEIIGSNFSNLSGIANLLVKLAGDPQARV